MMKKLLVLLIALAMTSMVFGAVTMEVLVNGMGWDGVSSVLPSDIITVTLLDDAVNLSPYNVGCGTAVNQGDFLSLMIPAGSLGVAPDPQPQGDGFAFTWNWTYLFTPVPADDIIYELEFHVPDDAQHSDMILVDFSGTYGTIELDDYDTAIHVTPEPMTMALLGLGGLFLRRRK
jgi:hypothetical protein